MKLPKHLFSRTFIGAVMIAIGRALRETKGKTDPSADTGGAVLEGVGTVVAGYGIRDAIGKSAQGRVK